MTINVSQNQIKIQEKIYFSEMIFFAFGVKQLTLQSVRPSSLQRAIENRPKLALKEKITIKFYFSIFKGPRACHRMAIKNPNPPPPPPTKLFCP